MAQLFFEHLTSKPGTQRFGREGMARTMRTYTWCFGFGAMIGNNRVKAFIGELLTPMRSLQNDEDKSVRITGVLGGQVVIQMRQPGRMNADDATGGALGRTIVDGAYRNRRRHRLDAQALLGKLHIGQTQVQGFRDPYATDQEQLEQETVTLTA